MSGGLPPGLWRTSLTPAEFRDLLRPPEVVPEEPERFVLEVEITKTQVEKLLEYLRYHDIHGTLRRVSRETEEQ